LPKTPDGAILALHQSGRGFGGGDEAARSRPLHDQVDSTAQMLDWFKRGSGPNSNAGIFELYRMLAEEARSGQRRSYIRQAACL
jgi:hypothetical protein